MYVEGVSPAVVAITGVLSALAIFAMPGGVSAMIDDPWLFGVAIAPGLQLARSWLQKRQPEAGGQDA